MVGKKALIIGGAIVAGLALVGLFLPNETTPSSKVDIAERWQPDPRGVALAKLLSADDFFSYLAGAKSVGDWNEVQRIDEHVTAVQLHSAYSQNEVAADNRFKRRTISLTGRLEKISKDVFDNIYLVVDGGGYLKNVQAYLTDSASSEAAQMRPGENVALICTGAGMVLSFPIAKECQPVKMVFQANREGLDRLVDRALTTDATIGESIKLLIGYSYVVGTTLPKGNACESATPDDMADCGKAMDGLPRGTASKLYEEFARQHNFPPRPKQ